jgi:dipeptidyl aminopeptidase/acylaminoacyl peptidase
LLLFALLPLVPAQRQRSSALRREFRSTDKSIVAILRWTEAPEATAESRIEFRTGSGKLILRKDYTSQDGEHGYGVSKASWTPDSQFFVYSLESSGGHSAWHSPVQVFSRRTSKVFSLDDALSDAVMNPQFSVTAPDKVTVELYFSGKEVTVSLSSLRAEPKRR